MSNAKYTEVNRMLKEYQARQDAIRKNLEPERKAYLWLNTVKKEAYIIATGRGLSDSQLKDPIKRNKILAEDEKLKAELQQALDQGFILK